ncbi:ligand-binding protein SH3 [Dyella monticola]|uniref:Ligand-binding protein SH3 n=1 Tax=Dyella monticola TaxID=1927958 RepID=A0A370X9B3_9GAMM|nr:SH3 domain-containing protein [Dyella monticola]RDS84968.1 ligand-binding protein SH3 [Dyella monticola]
MKRIMWSLVTLLLMIIPAAAFAVDGYTVATVNMFAGPDPQYPQLLTLDPGTPVDVQGCTAGWEWCDVIAAGNRGWVAGPYIEYMYDNQPVIVTDYGPRIGIPIVTFAIGTYWGRYYGNRPFYRDRARWVARPLPVRPFPGPRPPVRPYPPGGQRPQPGPGPRPMPPGGNRPQPPGYRPPPSEGNRPPPPAGNRPQPPAGNRPQPHGNEQRPAPKKPAPRPHPEQGNNPPNNGGG